MTQTATEEQANRRRGREAARDLITNSGDQPGRGEDSTVAPDRLAETARAIQQAAATTQTAAMDPHFRAGTTPAGPTRIAGNQGARPDGTTPQTSRDRGTDRGPGDR
jgi:hypothetical protein